VEVEYVETFAADTPVYNLVVADVHDYFASDNMILVHNVGCGGGYPNPDPHMSAPPVRYEPESIEEVMRMRRGEGPRTKASHGVENIEAHHRNQVPISEGGVMDELTFARHRGKGQHTRHGQPSRLTQSQRSKEIYEHWKRRGNDYILPGGEGI